MAIGPYKEIPPQEKFSEMERLLIIEKEIRDLRRKKMEGDPEGVHFSTAIKVLTDDWLRFTGKGDEVLGLSPVEHEEFVRLEENLLRGELTDEEMKKVLLWKERFDTIQKH